MEKLAKKFEEIIREQYWSWCCTDKELDGSGPIFKPEMISIGSSEYCAEECKKIAIEFAKRLMSTEVCSKRIVRVESGYECSVEYPHSVPPEYSLMYGELARFGDKMFDKFIETYE